MLLESTIPDGRVGSGWGLDDNDTNSAQLELGLGLSLAIYDGHTDNHPDKHTDIQIGRNHQKSIFS